MSALRYEMVIVWSEEGDCYRVHLPDFPEQTYRAHGDSYKEAARNGQEVLELLLEEDGLPLPKPNLSAAEDILKNDSIAKLPNCDLPL